MIERPIIFTAQMVRALLVGTKTQTRRPFKYPTWSKNGDDIATFGPERKPALLCRETGEFVDLDCPLGKIGEVLWVRETARAEVLKQDCADGRAGTFGVRYIADHQFIEIGSTNSCLDAWTALYNYQKRKGTQIPAIHMPRWVARIYLEITTLRIERLNSISEDDARAEGFTGYMLCPHGFEIGSSYCGPCSLGKPNRDIVQMMTSGATPAGEFLEAWARLYGSTYGPEDENPYVWVIGFARRTQ